MAHELNVFLHAKCVGTLSLVSGRLSFQYSPQALAAPAFVPLSQSLPGQPEPFDDHQSRPFFAGLLPEGRMRQLIAKQAQVSSQNEYGLLEFVGGECAGAVSLSIGDLPQHKADAGSVQWLSDAELAAVIDELPKRPMLAGKEGLRLSLAGAQDKLPVVYDGSRIGLPMHGSPSTHILKPPIREVEDSVTNEAFCLSLAKGMKLPAAEATIIRADHQSALLVERYDRHTDTDGQVRRIHQEDFCQALGVVSELKYQNEGGPGFAQCFDMLRSSSRPSAPHVLNLLDYAVFNALVGNHDAHGKNFSLLYRGDKPVLAPLYDVVSTAIYPELTNKMAMKLGGKYKFTEVMERHWDRFSDDNDLGKAQVRKRVRELATHLPNVARQLASSAPQFAGNPIVDRILNVIEHRAALTLERLPTNAQRLADGIRSYQESQQAPSKSSKNAPKMG